MSVSPKKVKKELYDVTMILKCHRAMESKCINVTLRIKVDELNYGPCLHWRLHVDKPCEMGWSWDDHPLLLCRARSEQDRKEPISSCGEILEDTPAVRALLADLCSTEERKMYSTGWTRYKSQLIAALEMFWS